MNTTHYNTAIVKVSTDVCTNALGRLDEQILANLLEQIMEVKKYIQQVLLVTSGAAALGRAEYGAIKKDDEDADTRGMYSSAGQPILMHWYRDHLREKYGCIANQFLVTKETFTSELRLKTLLGRLGKIRNYGRRGLPIFNENDAIADEEIMFTDNDELMMMLAKPVNADVIVSLSGIDGLRKDVNDAATLIPSISLADQKRNRQYVRSGSNGNGRGGMKTKYGYGCELAKQGRYFHIADGRVPDVLTRLLLQRESIGSVFLPH